MTKQTFFFFFNNKKLYISEKVIKKLDLQKLLLETKTKAIYLIDNEGKIIDFILKTMSYQKLKIKLLHLMLSYLICLAAFLVYFLTQNSMK